MRWTFGWVRLAHGALPEPLRIIQELRETQRPAAVLIWDLRLRGEEFQGELSPRVPQV